MKEKIDVREHIALTAFQPGDQPNLIFYLNDPVLYRNTLRIPSPYTATDADQWLNVARESQVQYGQTYNWAIRHVEYGVIGGIGAFLRTGVEGHLDEIGYWLGAPFRGQGIMTDAVIVLCNWLFEARPQLVRIEAKVHADNPASVCVLEKAGFEREGFARKHTVKNGEFIDVVLLARLRD